MRQDTKELRLKVWSLAGQALAIYAKKNPNMTGEILESSQFVVYAFMYDAVRNMDKIINPAGEDEQNLCDSCLPSELRLNPV